MDFSQVCIGNYPYAWYSFDAFLDSMERMQISRIELWAGAPHLYFDDCSYADIALLAKKVRGRGLMVRCVTPEQYRYPINLASANRDERKRSLQYFKRAVDAATEFACSRVLISSGWRTLDEEQSEAEKYFLESVCELAHSACFHGVRVVLEPMYRPIDLVRTAAQAKALLDRINFDPGIGVMMDLDMSARSGESPKTFASQFKAQDFVHVHLNDGNPGGHLALGDGRLPLESDLNELWQADFTGDMGLEIVNDRYLQNPEAAVRTSVAYLCRYFEEKTHAAASET